MGARDVAGSLSVAEFTMTGISSSSPTFIDETPNRRRVIGCVSAIRLNRQVSYAGSTKLHRRRMGREGDASWGAPLELDALSCVTNEPPLLVDGVTFASKAAAENGVSSCFKDKLEVAEREQLPRPGSSFLGAERVQFGGTPLASNDCGREVCACWATTPVLEEPQNDDGCSGRVYTVNGGDATVDAVVLPSGIEIDARACWPTASGRCSEDCG